VYVADWIDVNVFERSCGLSCVNSGTCFPAQGANFNWESMQMLQNDSEPSQMLAQMGENGLFTVSD
jgi:hypothetical protein